MLHLCHDIALKYPTNVDGFTFEIELKGACVCQKNVKRDSSVFLIIDFMSNILYETLL